MLPFVSAFCLMEGMEGYRRYTPHVARRDTPEESLAWLVVVKEGLRTRKRYGDKRATTRCCGSPRSPFPARPKDTRLVGMDQTGGRTHDPTGDQTRTPYDRTVDHPDELTTVTVSDAAELLGLSTEAVRMRVKRGTLASTKIGGTVYVLLDGPNERPNVKPNARPNSRTNDRPNPRPNIEAAPVVANLQEHNADLRDQVEHLRRELDTRNEELRRKDTIIMAMTQRIPELETAPEPRDARETASEPQSSSPAPYDQDGSQEKPSWWRRFFGFV
jgi:hypothetical protein